MVEAQGGASSKRCTASLPLQPMEIALGGGQGGFFSKQEGFPLPPGEAAADSPPRGPELLQHVCCCGKELMVSCHVWLGEETRA